MDEYSDEYKHIVKDFENHLSCVDFERHKDVHVSFYDYDHETQRDSFDFMKAHTEVLDDLASALKVKDDTIEGFIGQHQIQNERRWSKLSKKWTEAKAQLKKSIEAYPRNITQDAIYAAVENRFDYELKHNEFRDLCYTGAPSERKHLKTIKQEIELFKKVAKAFESDDDWVQEIREEGATDADETEVPLTEVFEGIKARLECLELTNRHETIDLRHDILNALGKLGISSMDTQLWHLADLGVHLSKILEDE